MKAFSLSPGGLLLPYHLGALQSLMESGALQPTSDIVGGSSAGSIAAMSYGCGLKPTDILEATIKVSDQCHDLKRARGNLLPLLRHEMETRVGPEEFDFLMTSAEEGGGGRRIGIAYKEIFPQRKSYLQCDFESRQDLFQSVSYSCMFPFFATNYPCMMDSSSFPPRLMVDGFFSVPRARFGCPDFEPYLGDPKGQEQEDDGGTVVNGKENNKKPDRTIAISVFPKDMIGMEAFSDDNCISPSIITEEDSNQLSVTDMFRIATQASSREELTQVYEMGARDAEAWCRREEQRKSRVDHTEATIKLDSI
ncbi:unnamed protein product [Cylindrotheca closterium]|uniref:PNPLA domain-containing protein n=1 Tax=Cylindrotheca closterium TaxID=2856 RepID=A0AAD2CFN5_9STRA|nr:unnamed protein product [Cylindrotheca closterium]